MSSAIAKAALLKPTLRLDEAIRRFEADLSPEQRDSFTNYRLESPSSPPSPHDVMRLTAEIDRDLTAKHGSSSRCVGPRLTTILQAVQQFAVIVDGMVGGSQNVIACCVWSLVRMTLLSIVNSSSFVEKVSALFMDVGRSAPRYEEMVLLYPRSKFLQHCLCEYFIVVVRLCHQLVTITKRPGWASMMLFLSESDVKNYKAEFKRWGESIKQEVDMLVIKGLKRQNSLIDSLIKHTNTESAYRRRVDILDACSKYDHQSTWSEIRKLGTPTLFRENVEYENWKSQERSCTLVWKGKLGSGKSVILANIVHDLHLNPIGSKCPVAYFFCRHDIHDSLKARTIIGSLVRQLLGSVPSHVEWSKRVCETALSAPNFSCDQMMKVLQDAMPPGSKAYLVLDGLDECDDAQRHTVIEQLKKLQRILALRLCVSFRLEADNSLQCSLKVALRQFSNPRCFKMPDDNPDIKSFISSELERCIKSQKLVLGDESLFGKIETALQQGAQGMFLWVALEIESLCDAKTDEAICQALADLPKDLPDTFSRILQKSVGPEHHQRRVLELITAAPCPLTTEQLREALSVKPGDVEWKPREHLNDVYSALRECGSLVTVDEEADTVRLVHHSFKKFLLGEFGNSGNGMFTLRDADKAMGDVVVTYLNYDIFETQLSTKTTRAPKMHMGAVPSTIIDSIGSPIHKSLALKLLRPGRHLHCDIGRTLVNACHSVKLAPSKESQHPFRAYAKSHWLQHARYTSQHRLVHSLLLEYFDPGMVDIEIGSEEECHGLLLWAIADGYQAIERQLADSSDHQSSGESAAQHHGQTSLSEAVQRTQETLVTLLLGRDIHHDVKEEHDRALLLLWAVFKGYRAIMDLLFKEGEGFCRVHKRNWTPLSLVVEKGLEAIVRLLIEKGADLREKSEYNRTPLLTAARNGQEAVARVMVGPGIDIKAKDTQWEASHLGARNTGQEAVARLLLERSFQLKGRDDLDWGTLLRHARSGFPAAIGVLINNRSADKTARRYV